GLRSEKSAAAEQSLREHAPAAGHRSRQVRFQHGDADGAGNRRLSLRSARWGSRLSVARWLARWSALRNSWGINHLCPRFGASLPNCHVRGAHFSRLSTETFSDSSVATSGFTTSTSLVRNPG